MNEHDITQQAAARICASMSAAAAQGWGPPIYLEHLTPNPDGEYCIGNGDGHIYRWSAASKAERMALKPTATREQRIADYSARMAVMLVAAVQRELNKDVLAEGIVWPHGEAKAQ